jgi:dephospho-CoA kinase
MSKPLIIGLTGGIGSGKSTAASIFQTFGIPVLDADTFAKEALNPGTVCYQRTLDCFGKEYFKEDGTVDRKRLAETVFKDEKRRNELNGIIHPYVLDRMNEETRHISNECVIWEVPLLFESGFDRCCDITVAVLCREDLRIRRICLRDGASDAQARERLRAQISDEKRAAMADEILYDEGTEQELMHRAAQLVRKWKALK